MQFMIETNYDFFTYVLFLTSSKQVDRKITSQDTALVYFDLTHITVQNNFFPATWYIY